MGDDREGLANSSLNTSRVPPQEGREADSMPSNRTLPGDDHQKGLDETEPSTRAPAGEDRKG